MSEIVALGALRQVSHGRVSSSARARPGEVVLDLDGPSPLTDTERAWLEHEVERVAASLPHWLEERV